jgi:hypothetical protein
MTNELVTVNDGIAERPSQAEAVCNLLAAAIDRGMAPESLEKLVALQERVMAKQAEMAFHKAMQGFQSETTALGKSREVDTGKYKYKYAELSYIADMIRPGLDKHGLSFTFDSKIENGNVLVNCIIAHIDGHSKVTQFMAPIDPSARMNDTQKVASAVTYARRYALVLALGLVVGEFDDDGRESYPQVDRDQTAPKQQPRAQRPPKPDRGFVTADLIKTLHSDWTAFYGEAETFPEWVQRVAKRTFAVNKAAEWTWADFDACDAVRNDALGLSKE